MWRDCESCGGEGFVDHECGDDTCCCGAPDDLNVACGVCLGHGGFNMCISSHGWCLEHPLPDRADIKPGQIEWFTFDEVKG